MPGAWASGMDGTAAGEESVIGIDHTGLIVRAREVWLFALELVPQIKPEYLSRRPTKDGAECPD